MYALILKHFVRSRIFVFTFGLILLLGIVSIFIGRQFLVKQRQNIAEVTRQQKEHIQRNVAYHKDNIGGLLYYVRFAFINAPNQLSALSIGQRDVNAGIQSVTIRNLEAQRYDTDLSNPANLVSGNLDLGFVIIYLFPLMIIAITFNLLSEEEERGTWHMVVVQSKSAVSFLLQKLSARAISIFGALLLLFVFAVACLSLAIDASVVAFVIISLLYLLFWFALSFVVISFRRSSSFNALTLLALWVLLAILLPAAVNNFVSGRYPVPEALSTLIKQRDGYHKQWDMDRKGTMERFYSHYPQFRHYGVPQGEFSYAWYYAMQQMGDDESREESRAMHEKIMMREKISRKLAMVNPAMHTQMVFNDLAGTGLQDHLDFLEQTAAFHEKMRLYFYPRIFGNAPVAGEEWDSFQPEYGTSQKTIPWVTSMLPMGLATMVLILIAWIRMNNSTLVGP